MEKEVVKAPADPKATEKAAEKAADKAKRVAVKINVPLTATQFKIGDTHFAGQPVRSLPQIDEDGNPIPYRPGIDEPPFVIVPTLAGETVRVEDGMWLVQYPDGKLESWSEAKYKTMTTADEEGRSPDPWSGPLWKNDEGKVQYPQPGRANPNELLDGGEITEPGHPDNPMESIPPESSEAAPAKKK